MRGNQERALDAYDYMDSRENRFLCIDCGEDTSVIHEYYMVHNEIWNDAGMNASDGMLCIGCLEARLQRRLRLGDFTTAPINHIFHQSPRLRNRMGKDKH